ncbi:MAG: hypothetical protein ACTSYL_12075 [Candidatus Thorarchaeota archaeon]
MSELKCCPLCPAFSTCTHKGECCPECPYFDPDDSICLAPEIKKARARAARKARTKIETSDDVDPETFLFEDEEDEEYEPARGKTGDFEDDFEDEESDDFDW